MAEAWRLEAGGAAGTGTPLSGDASDLAGCNAITSSTTGCGGSDAGERWCLMQD
jgi:hypothetical protein